MPKMRILLALLAILTLTAWAQDPAAKRPLTHDDYDQWQRIGSRVIDKSGQWMAYTVDPQVGDGVLLVRAVDEKEARHRIPLGERPSFSHDGRFLLFTRGVAREAQRAAEWAKLNGDRKAKAPESHLAVLDLETGTIRELEGVRAAQWPSEGPSVLIFRPKKEEPKQEEKPAEEKPAEGKPAESGEKPAEGKPAEAGEKPTEAGEKPKPAESGEKPQPVEAGEKPSEPKAAPEVQEPATTEPNEPGPEGPRARRGRGEGRRPGGRRFGGRRRPGTEAGEAPGAPGAGGDETKKEEGKSWRKDGEPLALLDLTTGEETRLEGVVSYGLIEDGQRLWYVRNSKKDDVPYARGLFVRAIGGEDEQTLVAGAANYMGLSTDREDQVLAFLTDRRDREAKEPKIEVWTWDFGTGPAMPEIGHEQAAAVPGGYRITDRSRIGFSRDGSVLTLTLLPPEDPELRKVLPEDRVSLDIWNWRDPLLQTMQAKGRGRGGSLTAVWHRDAKRLVPLTSVPEESARLVTEDGSRALLSDPRPYAQEVSWDGNYSDLYVLNTISGDRRLLARRTGGGFRGGGQPSPSGRYVLEWRDGHWHCHDLSGGPSKNLTEGMSVSFADELWDTPAEARSYGVAGWLAGEKAVLLYDRYDIWRIDMNGGDPVCVTDGLGRAGTLSFRIIDRDPEDRYVPTDKALLLATTNTETMESGFYTDEVVGLMKPRKLFLRAASVGRPTFAEDGDRVFFTMERFDTPSDVWTCADDRFENPVRLTNVNAQQASYRWGHAELVHWTSSEGQPLKGILIKPEGFDPTKKYPMMVYFYEKRSQTLHNYVAPAPGTSPNPTYYVSNGYLWFIPDIHYTLGYPGESCVDCVVSGVQSLIEKGFVDREAIGAAGHSWGGYQTAFLVTRTNIFAAVESGAPVSNMTSAYGGIRWGSGMSRAFQYEKTQSRIGATLWERPMRYIENSPIFMADRVETPVLMIHNDQDGAVPWYQGIEYFCALRRLGKEVYLFNYNGQDHGLRRRADMKDWTKRMQQYFDHHLRGHPAPEWMEATVPYEERAAEKIRFNDPWAGPEKPVEAPAAKPAPTAVEEAVEAEESAPSGGR